MSSGYAFLGDQLKRASLSIPLKIGENMDYLEKQNLKLAHALIQHHLVDENKVNEFLAECKRDNKNLGHPTVKEKSQIFKKKACF